jgi:hypothetical protein
MEDWSRFIPSFTPKVRINIHQQAALKLYCKNEASIFIGIGSAARSHLPPTPHNYTQQRTSSAAISTQKRILLECANCCCNGIRRIHFNACLALRFYMRAMHYILFITPSEYRWIRYYLCGLSNSVMKKSFGFRLSLLRTAFTSALRMKLHKTKFCML